MVIITIITNPMLDGSQYENELDIVHPAAHGRQCVQHSVHLRMVICVMFGVWCVRVCDVCVCVCVCV